MLLASPAEISTIRFSVDDPPSPVTFVAYIVFSLFPIPSCPFSFLPHAYTSPNAGTTSSNTPVKTVISNGISSSIGTGHVAIQGQNGKLYTWGRNDNGQLGTGNLSNNLSVGKIANGITDISASGNETIVKDMERKVYGTGRNTSGELGIEGNTNITTLTEIALPNTTNVKYIKAGKTSTTLMLSDGTVWSTGVGTNGELGNGTNENTWAFVQGLTLVEEENSADTGETTEKPLTNVLMIGRNNGGLNTTVIVGNGDVYATGDNTHLQIRGNNITSTNYYNKMEFYNLDYADKEIEIDSSGYTINKNKLLCLPLHILFFLHSHFLRLHYL